MKIKGILLLLLTSINVLWSFQFLARTSNINWLLCLEWASVMIKQEKRIKQLNYWKMLLTCHVCCRTRASEFKWQKWLANSWLKFTLRKQRKVWSLMSTQHYNPTKVGWKLLNCRSKLKVRQEFLIKLVNFTILMQGMKEASSSNNSTWPNYMKLLLLKLIKTMKNQLRKKIHPHLLSSSRKCKHMHHWPSAIWSWRTFKKLRSTWINTTEWLKNQKHKIMLQIAHTTWQNYLNRKTKAKKRFNSIKPTSRQLSHKNKTRKIGNL